MLPQRCCIPQPVRLCNLARGLSGADCICNRYNVRMHRICALLLLSITGFLPIAPAVCANAAMQLPACCRAKGKHHCVVARASTGQDVVQNASVQAVGARCPIFPTRGTAATAPHAFLPLESERLLCPILSQPAVRAHTGDLFRFSFCVTCRKRGPPSAAPRSA
jgi:hypothetical protein